MIEQRNFQGRSHQTGKEMNNVKVGVEQCNRTTQRSEDIHSLHQGRRQSWNVIPEASKTIPQ